ncbi:CRISPR-associated endonuclease Cas1 [Tepidicella xavieri]|uniref:CRISPR-associated endonuclease Cas1 n=1 Tax=Tepidicella xavieri TaxID=360241 RepID=A0A4R6UCF4_9BURK|nr:CRISPR-associated endonuclease Cas1 [Tepidicella xavieri]TDQ44380.1 CRISPR-associated Cas1 family protein [Tepidicella xavieri]
MSTLYVDRKGVSLRLDGGTLVFEEAGARVAAIPLAPLERVVLRGDVTISASLLGKLGQSGIGVLVLSGRKAEPALFMQRPHYDARRRILQWQRSLDSNFRLDVARDLLQRKVTAQRHFLLERAQDDLMHRYELRTAAERMDAACRTMASASTLAALRGAEGAAAQAFFMGYQALFAPSLHFSARNRRPPQDPVNAVLSLGYTLLHAEAVLQAHAVGLDPFVGFLHELDYGRESLASDLVEPHRCGVERLTWRLFRERVLTVEHFSRVQGACLLGKAGRQHFYRSWSDVSEGLRQSLRSTCLTLVTAVTGEEALEAPATVEGDDG